MRERLQIGEVAKLLGISTKTVRHYHKRGLLAEPPRSEGGYRLYGASDLLRLQQIRRLQGLGLSLEQIGALLSDAEPEPALWAVIRSLLADVTAQIEALEARRARLQRLLDDETLEALEVPDALPPILAYAQEHLLPHLADVEPALLADMLAFDRRLFALLDSFQWPGDYAEGHREMVQHLAAHPDHFRQFLPFVEPFLALATLPEDSPEVEALAARLRAEPMFLPTLDNGPGAPPFPAPFQDAMAEMLASALSPAQRRLLELVQAG